MKNNTDQLKRIFCDALAQPAPKAENEKQFAEFIQLLRDGFQPKARRLARRMSSDQMKPFARR